MGNSGKQMIFFPENFWHDPNRIDLKDMKEHSSIVSTMESHLIEQDQVVHPGPLVVVALPVVVGHGAVYTGPEAVTGRWLLLSLTLCWLLLTASL